MRFPLQCVVLQNFSGFPDTTALQRKLIYAAGRCPPIVRLLFLPASFHFSFAEIISNPFLLR